MNTNELKEKFNKISDLPYKGKVKTINAIINDMNKKLLKRCEDQPFYFQFEDTIKLNNSMETFLNANLFIEDITLKNRVQLEIEFYDIEEMSVYGVKVRLIKDILLEETHSLAQDFDICTLRLVENFIKRIQFNDLFFNEDTNWIEYIDVNLKEPDNRPNYSFEKIANLVEMGFYIVPMKPKYGNNTVFINNVITRDLLLKAHQFQKDLINILKKRNGCLLLLDNEVTDPLVMVEETIQKSNFLYNENGIDIAFKFDILGYTLKIEYGVLKADKKLEWEKFQDISSLETFIEQMIAEEMLEYQFDTSKYIEFVNWICLKNAVQMPKFLYLLLKAN